MPEQFLSTETVANDSADPLVLVLEPWGEEVLVPPGAVYEVRAASDVPGTLELAREGNVVTCWAWPHSTLQVRDGERLVTSIEIAALCLQKGCRHDCRST